MVGSLLTWFQTYIAIWKTWALAKPPKQKVNMFCHLCTFSLAVASSSPYNNLLLFHLWFFLYLIKSVDICNTHHESKHWVEFQIDPPVHYALGLPHIRLNCTEVVIKFAFPLLCSMTLHNMTAYCRTIWDNHCQSTFIFTFDRGQCWLMTKSAMCTICSVLSKYITHIQYVVFQYMVVFGWLKFTILSKVSFAVIWGNRYSPGLVFNRIRIRDGIRTDAGPKQVFQ